MPLFAEMKRKKTLDLSLRKPLKTKGLQMEARTGIEPVYEVLQTSA
jgi:hypothetical protein